MTFSIEILATAGAIILLFVLYSKLVAFIANNIVKIIIGSIGIVIAIQSVAPLNISMIDFLELIKPFYGRQVVAFFIKFF